MKEKEKIIAYIDKLLEKYPKNYYLLTIAEFVDSLQEEPVSEDLEEAAKKYGTKKHPMTTIGANESAYDFKAGAVWQKEQMMAKGVDGVVHHFDKCKVASVHYNDPTGVPMAYYFTLTKGLSAEDKVKIIVIKND